MTIASAISVHPIAAHATGEVVSEVLDRLGPRPGLVVVLVTPAFEGALDDIVNAVDALLAPELLVSVVSAGVLAGNTEAETGPGIALWVSERSCPGAVRFPPGSTVHTIVDGLEELADHGPIVLLADPLTFPARAVLDEMWTRGTDPGIVGGLLANGSGHGGVRLGLGRGTATGGAVAFVVSADPIDIAVSHGTEPLTGLMMLSDAGGSMVHEIDGRPAMESVNRALGSIDPEQRQHAARNLHLGLRDGEMLPILGADRDRGSIAVAGEVTSGLHASLHVWGPTQASDDLRRSVMGGPVDGALVFTCTERGRDMFGSAHHDADVISDSLGSSAIGGVFCSARMAPIGGRTRVLGSAVVTAIFGRSHH